MSRYYKYFYSIYIQIFRLQSLKRFFILELITFDNINNQLYLNL